MNWPFRAVTTVVLFVTACVAGAQEHRPSHIPVPRNNDSDPARVFQDSIQKSRLRADLDSILKQLGPSGSLTNADQVRKLLAGNPQLMDLMQGLQANDPESRDRLQKLLGEANSRNRGSAVQAIERELKRLATDAGGRDVGREPTRSRNGEPAARRRRFDSSIGPGESSASAESDAHKSRRQWANSIADWTEHWPRQNLGGLKDSEAMRDLVRQFSASAAKAAGSDGDNNLAAQLALWESRIHSVRDWLPQEIPDALRPAMGWDLGGMSRPNLRGFDFSRPSFPSSPNVSFSGGDLGIIANVLLVGLALAIAAAVFWKMKRIGLSPEAKARRALGPWPLDPSRVTTREELIQAFEYLSLLRYGEPARTWNHHIIAERLGNADARKLAELYERARYAPSSGQEPDWTSARQPLTALAGVS